MTHHHTDTLLLSHSTHYPSSTTHWAATHRPTSSKSSNTPPDTPFPCYQRMKSLILSKQLHALTKCLDRVKERERDLLKMRVLMLTGEKGHTSAASSMPSSSIDSSETVRGSGLERNTATTVTRNQKKASLPSRNTGQHQEGITITDDKRRNSQQGTHSGASQEQNSTRAPPATQNPASRTQSETNSNQHIQKPDAQPFDSLRKPTQKKRKRNPAISNMDKRITRGFDSLSSRQSATRRSTQRYSVLPQYVRTSQRNITHHPRHQYQQPQWKSPIVVIRRTSASWPSTKNAYSLTSSTNTSVQISLRNLSQNWNQYNIASTWHSLLLNMHNPWVIAHILTQHIFYEQSPDVANIDSSQIRSGTSSSEDSHTQPSTSKHHDNHASDFVTTKRRSKSCYWLFDNLQHLVELLCCGCPPEFCVGTITSMPQIVYGMHLGVHHWIFSSKQELLQLIQAYKSQFVSLKDTLRPILRITTHLEQQYRNQGLNIKTQEKELREILDLFVSHGIPSLYGIIMELDSEMNETLSHAGGPSSGPVGGASSSASSHSPSTNPSVCQLRRGFRYLEIVCDECMRVQLGKPKLVFVQSIGSPPPDDVFSVYSESARREVNHALEESLLVETGHNNNQKKSSVWSKYYPSHISIDSWLLPLQEISHLSKQWKEIDPHHHVQVVADPSSFLLSNTHSLSVFIRGSSLKSFWKPKKVHFALSPMGISTRIHASKSRVKYEQYQVIHLNEGISFLFSLKARGLFFKPYLDELRDVEASEKANSQYSDQDSLDSHCSTHSMDGQLQLVPTIIYGDSSHVDPGDCLNPPLLSSRSNPEPVFFGLPLLSEGDRLRFEGIGMYEHLLARSGLLEYREKKYATEFIEDRPKSRL